MHAFYQACLSFLFLARPPFLSPAPRPGPPFPLWPLLLNLFLEERKARAAEPHAALPTAHGRMKARAGPADPHLLRRPRRVKAGVRGGGGGGRSGGPGTGSG